MNDQRESHPIALKTSTPIVAHVFRNYVICFLLSVILIILAVSTFLYNKEKYIGSAPPIKQSTQISNLDEKTMPATHRLEPISSSSPVDQNNVSLHEEIEALQNRVNTVEEDIRNYKNTSTQNQSYNPQTLPLIIAYIQLKQTIYSGLPYHKELKLFQNLSSILPSKIQQDITRLTPYSEQRTPTQSQLKQELENLSATLKDTPPTETSVNWQERLKSQLAKLIVIKHKSNGPSHEPIDSLIKNLESDNLHEAQSTIDSLPDAIKIPLKDWILQLNNRIELDNIVTSIDDDLTSSSQPVLP